MGQQKGKNRRGRYERRPAGMLVLGCPSVAVWDPSSHIPPVAGDRAPSAKRDEWTDVSRQAAACSRRPSRLAAESGVVPPFLPDSGRVKAPTERACRWRCRGDGDSCDGGFAEELAVRETESGHALEAEECSRPVLED